MLAWDPDLSSALAPAPSPTLISYLSTALAEKTLNPRRASVEGGEPNGVSDLDSAPPQFPHLVNEDAHSTYLIYQIT